MIGQAFVGRLASGPNPLGVLGRRVGRAFLGWLASGPNPFEALELGRLARGAGPGPKVPTMLPLFLPGRKIIPDRKKKNKVDCHIIGNSLPLMLLNVQVNFVTFF